jgi:hypothetical protein
MGSNIHALPGALSFYRQITATSQLTFQLQKSALSSGSFAFWIPILQLVTGLVTNIDCIYYMFTMNNIVFSQTACPYRYHLKPSRAFLQDQSWYHEDVPR